MAPFWCSVYRFAERSLHGRTGQDQIDTRNEVSQESRATLWSGGSRDRPRSGCVRRYVACASSASRQVSAGRPQESPKNPQVSPRDRAARPLLFTQDRGAGRAGGVTGRPGESRSGAFASPFAGSSDSRSERTDRDVSLSPSSTSLSTEQSRRDESSCIVESAS